MKRRGRGNGNVTEAVVEIQGLVSGVPSAVPHEILGRWMADKFGEVEAERSSR